MITQEQFNRIYNCQESLDYVASQPSLAAAWANCERPDWLLAFARKARIATKAQFVRVAIGEAEAVLPIWTDKYPDDDRPQRAIQVAKDGIADHASGKRADAANAAAAASASASASGSYAASNAANAARAASDPFDAAAASAAVSAAYGARDAEATFRLAQCDRIRAIIPNPFIDNEGVKQ